MARIDNLTNFLTDVATSIKAKTGDSSLIPASQFDTKIAGITTGKLSNEEYAEANNDLDDIFQGVIIPNTYQQIEYIQLSGEQYIDTNYALWTNTNWKIEYKFDVNEFYNYNNMIGSLETYSADNEIWIQSDGNYYIRFTGVAKTSLGILELNTPYTIIHDNTGTNLLNYVNGELVQTSNKANTSLNYKLGLGHRKGGKFFKGKIYYAKFWNGNELVRNFVPVIRKSDNKIGLYDLVTNEFYMNAGTGSFIAGGNVDILNTKIKNILEEKNIKALPENIKIGESILGITGNYYGNLTDNQYEKANNVLDEILYQSQNVLPDTYQEVEYLESTGTQYIDTGYTFTNPNFKIELKYQKNTSLATNVFGVDTRVAPRQMHGNIYNRTFYLGNSSVVNNVTQELNTDYDYTVIFNENGAYFKLNENEYSYTGTTAWNGASLSDYLFTSHQTEAGGTLYNMKGRIYYARFYNENNVMVRNFIPCYRKSDEKPGMYDTVNGVFYTNEGTGDFVVGENVDVLNTKIESILTEKIMKIKPENIKSGVEILGVVGTYEGNQ